MATLWRNPSRTTALQGRLTIGMPASLAAGRCSVVTMVLLSLPDEIDSNIPSACLSGVPACITSRVVVSSSRNASQDTIVTRRHMDSEGWRRGHPLLSHRTLCWARVIAPMHDGAKEKENLAQLWPWYSSSVSCRTASWCMRQWKVLASDVLQPTA
ncbi:hypothetical protein LIA77_04722 [Sarocladium implicatum]|nr:hypothetical protein LIA77_04722 [Sarocladium implicatum]